MKLIRSTLTRVPLALSLATLLAAEAAGQVSPLFTWSGTVDREVVIVMNGRNVETRASGLDASFPPRLELRNALPRSLGGVMIQTVDGRGDVEIIEQPVARNNHTMVVRIRDPRGGRDNYRIVASWRPAGGDDRGRGGWDDRGSGGNDDRGRGNNGRGRGGNDDRWDDRDRDRDDRWDNRGPRDRDDRWKRARNNGRSGLLSWRGDVDAISEIRISGRRIEYRTRSGEPIRNARYDFRGNGLPKREVQLSLDVVRGRGRVELVQQPTRRNNYTAIIRVNDPRGGYGAYDFDLLW